MCPLGASKVRDVRALEVATFKYSRLKKDDADVARQGIFSHFFHFCRIKLLDKKYIEQKG